MYTVVLLYSFLSSCSALPFGNQRDGVGQCLRRALSKPPSPVERSQSPLGKLLIFWSGAEDVNNVISSHLMAGSYQRQPGPQETYPENTFKVREDINCRALENIT